MLILSRRLEQTIHIGDDIRLKILGIEGNRVKIGLEAPESITILRGELDTFMEDTGSQPEEKEFSGTHGQSPSN